MFQGYTLHTANLKSCPLTHSHSVQINDNAVINFKTLLSSLQVAIDLD